MWGSGPASKSWCKPGSHLQPLGHRGRRHGFAPPARFAFSKSISHCMLEPGHPVHSHRPMDCLRRERSCRNTPHVALSERSSRPQQLHRQWGHLNSLVHGDFERGMLEHQPILEATTQQPGSGTHAIREISTP